MSLAFASGVHSNAARAQEPDIVESITESPEPAAGTPAEGDVVESIGDEPSATAAPTQAFTPVAVPPVSADRFEVSGWVRQSFELGFANDVFRESMPDPLALRYDKLVSRTQLLVRARLSHERWFEATASALLTYSYLEQDTADPAEPFRGFNGQASRGVLEPQVMEVYLGFYTGPLDIRIGQQRVAWGRAVFLSPNDVLNAKDMRDPFVGELETRTIPTTMLRADLDLGFASLQAVVAPVYVPDRADVFASNWAGVQPDAPDEFRGLINLLSEPIDPTLYEQLNRLLQATQYPVATLAEPTAGARLSWSAADIDFNLYYHYGFDGPLVYFDPKVAAALAATDFSTAGLANLEPLLEMIDAGEMPIRVTFERRHHVGIDLGTVLGPVSLGLEVAYQSRRVLFQRDVMGTSSPAIQSVLSLEYQTNDPDKLLLLEGMYLRLLDPTAPLLIWSQNSAGVGALVRWPLWGPFGLDLRTLIGIMPLTQVVQPALTIKFDAWVVSIGGVWLHGEPYSFGQYFHRNSEVYVKLKGSF